MLFNIIFYLTFFTFSLGQLGRLSFSNQQLNIYSYELLVGVVLVYLFIKYRLKPILFFYKRFSIIYYFFIYLLFNFFLKINSFSSYENIISSLYLFRLIYYFSFFIYLLYFLKERKHIFKSLRGGLLLTLVLTLIFSVTQYFFYPELRNLAYLGWDPHLYRLFGTFLEPVVLSAILAQFFLFMLFQNDFIKNKRLRILLLAVIFVLILLTFSRGVYVAFLLTGVFFLIQRNKKYIFYFLFIFISAVLLLPKPEGEGVNLMRNSTIISRVNDYSAGFEVFKKDPFFGVGYNRIRYVKPATKQSTNNHAGASFHSSFMIVLASSGILGLLLYFLVLKGIAQINMFTFFSIVFLSIASFTDNLLLHPFILFILFTMTGYSLIRLQPGHK